MEQNADNQVAAEPTKAEPTAGAQEQAQSVTPAAQEGAGQPSAEQPQPINWEDKVKELSAELETYKKTISAQSSEINRWRTRALDTDSLKAQVAMLTEAFQEGLAGISDETREKLMKTNREYKEALALREAASQAMDTIVELAQEAGVSINGPELDKVRALFNERKFEQAKAEAARIAIRHLKSKVPTPADIEAEKKRLEAELKQARAASVNATPPPAPKDIASMSPVEKIKEGVAQLFKR